MKYTQTTPCKECPFLKSMKHGFTISRLQEFAGMDFHCHKSGEIDDDGYGDYYATEDSVACAGMLIFNKKRSQHNRYAMIAEELGEFDPTKLNMKAPVR